MISWLQSFSSWARSLFDNFSDFERMTFAVGIIRYNTFCKFYGWLGT